MPWFLLLTNYEAVKGIPLVRCISNGDTNFARALRCIRPLALLQASALLAVADHRPTGSSLRHWPAFDRAYTFEDVLCGVGAACVLHHLPDNSTHVCLYRYTTY